MPNYPEHLPGFPYLGEHRYSVTICTHDRTPAFTNDATVESVIAHFMRARAETGMAILAYCFMPDHVHLVLQGMSENADAKDFIKRAKQYSGHAYSRANDRARLWQRYSFEHVLRDDESTQRTVRYVLENPVRKGMVSHPREYRYIGSSEYTLDELLEFAYAPVSGEYEAG